MAEISKLKLFLLNMSDQEILKLIGANLPADGKISGKAAGKTAAADGSVRWYDRKLCGLSREGQKHLQELEEQLNDASRAHHVDLKQVRYLRQLKKMHMEVPVSFRLRTDPKAMFRRLQSFCRENDIPEDILQRMVPALITYMETGHMRPTLFVGEKGCGKTTAVRILAQEALRIPTEVVKVPQTDGGQGLTGFCATYHSADAGCLAKARLRSNSLLVAYIFDEIDKVPRDGNHASVDEALLSVTDESCSDVYDNFLETTLVGLEHCPMFFTANDLDKVNPILADRCNVIHFPNASASRIKSISRKYADRKMNSDLYSLIRFDYDLMDRHIDHLVAQDITSLRRHQQMIEAVLENALSTALVQETDEIVDVTEDMFEDAERSILGTVRPRIGFGLK